MTDSKQPTRRDFLTILERQLLDSAAVVTSILESNADGIDKMHSAYDFFHCIKGDAGSLELTTLESLADRGEQLCQAVLEEAKSSTLDKRCNASELSTIESTCLDSVNFMIEMFDAFSDSSKAGALKEGLDRMYERFESLDKIINGPISVEDKVSGPSLKNLLRSKKMSSDDLIAALNKKRQGDDRNISKIATDKSEGNNKSFDDEDYSSPFDEKYKRVFLDEVVGFIDQLEGQVIYTQDGVDIGSVDQCFRCFHTLKGLFGSAEISMLVELVHAAEDVVKKIQSRQLLAIDGFGELLVEITDYMRDEMVSFESSDYKPRNPKRLLKSLNLLMQAAEHSDVLSVEKKLNQHYGTAPVGGNLVQVLVEVGLLSAEQLVSALAIKRKDGHTTLDSVIVNEGYVSSQSLACVKQFITERKKLKEPILDETKQDSAPSVEQRFYKLPAEYFDRLRDHNSALVSLQKLLEEYATKQGDGHLNRLSEILQETCLKIHEDAVLVRMQPLTVILNPLRRTVRDCAKLLGKHCHLESSGENILLDKPQLDALSGILMHLTNNAIDHGIERPDERLMVDKPRSGVIVIDASTAEVNCEAMVTLKIRDDGRGVSRDKLKRALQEKEGLSLSEIDELSDDELLGYLFKTGLSTKEQVTDISGRGVGLDSVKDKVEEFGGTISLESSEGQGSCFTICLPQKENLDSAVLDLKIDDVEMF